MALRLLMQNMMNLSDFGQRFRGYSGITHLMDDLSEGLAQPGVVMLGGGNPAAIPEVKALLETVLSELLQSGKLVDTLSNYDAPQGKASFTETLAEYFSQQLLFSFSRNPAFKTVERQDLQKILKELEIQHTGLVDEENAVEVGRMLGAKMIITGKMIEKETSYVIFLKLVQIETAEILSVTKLLVDKRLGITG